MTRARKLKVSVLAAGGVALLAACSVHPGAAAVVGDQSISVDRVDAVAQALCSGQSGAGMGQPVASRGARQTALAVLVESTLSQEFGQAKGITPDQHLVSQAVEQNQADINALPVDERPAFREAVQDYAEGQLILVKAGRQFLASQGKTTADDRQALAIGQRLRSKFVDRSVDVSVDPRFGSWNDRTNSLQSGSGSLSVAVSADAKAAAGSDSSTGWAASLPATQQCG